MLMSDKTNRREAVASRPANIVCGEQYEKEITKLKDTQKIFVEQSKRQIARILELEASNRLIKAQNDGDCPKCILTEKNKELEASNATNCATILWQSGQIARLQQRIADFKEIIRNGNKEYAELKKELEAYEWQTKKYLQLIEEQEKELEKAKDLCKVKDECYDKIAKELALRVTTKLVDNSNSLVIDSLKKELADAKKCHGTYYCDEGNGEKCRHLEEARLEAKRQVFDDLWNDTEHLGFTKCELIHTLKISMEKFEKLKQKHLPTLQQDAPSEITGGNTAVSPSKVEKGTSLQIRGEAKCKNCGKAINEHNLGDECLGEQIKLGSLIRPLLGTKFEPKKQPTQKKEGK